MDEKSKEDEVIDVLKVMNEDENIHGILMFRPLPPHIDEDRVRNHIEPSKRMDGISDASVGSLFTGNRIGFPPCTAEAAVAILDYYGIEVSGKKAVVIGRSLVVGKTCGHDAAGPACYGDGVTAGRLPAILKTYAQGLI